MLRVDVVVLVSDSIGVRRDLSQRFLELRIVSFQLVYLLVSLLKGLLIFLQLNTGTVFSCELFDSGSIMFWSSFSSLELWFFNRLI